MNGIDFTWAERQPDPARLRRVYDASRYTLDALRTHTYDLHQHLVLGGGVPR